MEICLLILAGAIGAFVKDVVVDNKLTLPKYDNGSIALGFLGGVIIGASVGYLVDQNPTTAFFSGYAGSQILESLVISNKKK